MLCRAELDGPVANLYSSTEEEFVCFLTTFPLVPESFKISALNAFTDVARETIN